MLHLACRSAIYAFDGRLGELLDPSLILAMLSGVALSFGFCSLLAAGARRSLTRGLLLAAGASIPLSVGFAAGELALYYHISPEVNGTRATSRTLADGTVVTQTTTGELIFKRKGEAVPTTVKLSPVKQRLKAGAPKLITANASGWYFFFFGLGSFFVGMSSAARLREAEHRAAEFERLAQQAQLRALRYQVNPHFLFNTLNSLSSLVMSKRDQEAEEMILSLSSFFRSTLAIDPTEDVTLTEEIALQRLYLDIEKARFPERLQVRLEIPEELQNARIPALLLQPVVENAIKYGVARSIGPVELEIRATRVGTDAMEVVVQNSGSASLPLAPDARSTGVGLSNVCERLRARYGDAATCRFGPGADGGFAVLMRLPLVFS